MPVRPSQRSPDLVSPRGSEVQLNRSSARTILEGTRSYRIHSSCMSDPVSLTDQALRQTDMARRSSTRRPIGEESAMARPSRKTSMHERRSSRAPLDQDALVEQPPIRSRSRRAPPTTYEEPPRAQRSSRSRGVVPDEPLERRARRSSRAQPLDEEAAEPRTRTRRPSRREDVYDDDMPRSRTDARREPRPSRREADVEEAPRRRRSSRVPETYDDDDKPRPQRASRGGEALSPPMDEPVRRARRASRSAAPVGNANGRPSSRAMAAPPAGMDDGEDDEDEFYDASANTRSAPATSQRPSSRATAAAAAAGIGAGAGAGAGVAAVSAKPKASSTRRHDSQLLASQAKSRSERVSKLTFADVTQSDAEMHEDIETARKALHLFLNSRMLDAYELIEGKSESRMYYAVGYAILSTIKAIMTYEHQDLGTAISHCKDSLHIANLLRKKSSAFASIGRFVRGAGPSVTWIASMTTLEKHAELVAAECSLLKAVLGIAYSGDLLGSLAEALHLRSAYGEYRSLLKYIEWEDKTNSRTSDEDFRSGVFLGSGCISLILGLLPSKVLKIMEVFGYEGSVKVGLDLLSRATGWSSEPNDRQPKRTIETEGIRSPICDMTMLCYHLVVSTFVPVPNVDIDFAEKVLDYHLQRYPEGVFFLYFHGRLYSTQALSAKAVECFKQARDVQEEYIQLKHICYWDMSLCNMSLNDWPEAYKCFTVLANENNWSKALYNYGRAAALYQTGDPSAQEEAKEIMERVPSMTQKIAGKSIPLEKFAARKARKMIEYGYLLLPAMDLAYITHCYTTASPRALSRRSLPTVEREIARLEADSHAVADDLCLAHFLHGVILRNLAFPEKHVKYDREHRVVDVKAAAAKAEASFKYVAENGATCEYDHYMLYFCHYELGRLYISMGRYSEARAELNIVMGGKNLGDHGRKGKYSMQNMCVLRSHGALETLDHDLK